MDELLWFNNIKTVGIYNYNQVNIFIKINININNLILSNRKKILNKTDAEFKLYCIVFIQ